MNLPNKLTVWRVVLAPLFLLVLLWNFSGHYAVSCLIFIVASLTDLLDGKLARKYGLVTNLGKFLDPLADKMLTTAAFLGLLAGGQIDVWAVFLILSREFLVTSVRLLAAKDGTVIAASLSGKIKTVLQMTAIIYFLLALEVTGRLETGFSALSAGLLIAGRVLIWLSVAATVISGAQYGWQYRSVLREKSETR